VSAHDLQAYLAIARAAAALAGEVVMPLFDSAIAVELKADRTPVTIADRRAEEAVREFVLRECPGHGFLGEEFGEVTGSGPYRWVVDPIDGTQSFIRHVPLFGTLVALLCEGEPVVGVIACHAAGETLHAATGLGCFAGERRVHVSAMASLGDATVTMSSPRGVWRRAPGGFAALATSGALLRSWGDCYGYVMVATGRAEVMLDPEMSLWDAAALYPVIREAGGRITTWEGEAGPGASTIATNGLLHEAVLDVLAAG
jgi:histidinol phosphatase-like enzyme (inositol monophosphatase family)